MHCDHGAADMIDFLIHHSMKNGFRLCCFPAEIPQYLTKAAQKAVIPSVKEVKPLQRGLCISAVEKDVLQGRSWVIRSFRQKIQVFHFLAVQSGILKWSVPRYSETSGVQLVHPDNHLRIRLEG